MITEVEFTFGLSFVLFASGFMLAAVGNMENEKPLITIGLYMILFSVMGCFSAWRIL